MLEVLPLLRARTAWPAVETPRPWQAPKQMPKRCWHLVSMLLAQRDGSHPRALPSFKIVGEVYDSDPALISFFQGGARDSIKSTADSTAFSILAQIPSTPMRRAWSRSSAFTPCHAS